MSWVIQKHAKIQKLRNEPVQLKIVHLRSSTILGILDPVIEQVEHRFGYVKTATYLIRSPDPFDKDSILALASGYFNGL